MSVTVIVKHAPTMNIVGIGKPRRGGDMIHAQPKKIFAKEKDYIDKELPKKHEKEQV